MKKFLSAIFGLFIFAQLAVADDTISNGLTLVLPSQGSTNWGTSYKNNFAVPISGHDHTGSGKGLQISTNAIATNAVTGAKIRLANNEYLKARNAANSADLNILKLDASNKLRLDTANVSSGTRDDLSLGAGNTPTFTSINLSGGNIFQTTSDGSDNASIAVGHTATTRGGEVIAWGNESIGTGQVTVASGNVSSAHINIQTPNSSSAIKFITNSTDRWHIHESSGEFAPVADDNVDIGDTTNAVKNLYLKQRTWTPTVVLTVTSGSATPTLRWARYFKIGKNVFFNFAIAFGNGTVSDLTVSAPTTSANLGLSIQGGSCFTSVNAGASREAIGWEIDAGGTDFEFQRNSGSWTGSSQVSCTGSYEEG